MTTPNELRETASLYDENTDIHPLLVGAAAEIERRSTLADKWNFECDELREDSKRLAAERDALQAANQDLQDWYDAAIADAKRYQWLRMQDWFDGKLCVVRDPKTVFSDWAKLGTDCPSRDRLDAAIDAAMKGEQP